MVLELIGPYVQKRVTVVTVLGNPSAREIFVRTCFVLDPESRRPATESLIKLLEMPVDMVAEKSFDRDPCYDFSSDQLKWHI